MTTTKKTKNKKRRLTKRSKVPCGLHGAHLTSEPLAGFLSSDDTDTFGTGRRRQPSAEQRERKVKYSPSLTLYRPSPPPFSPRDWKTTSQSLHSNSGEPSPAGFFFFP